jgi:hypothetical protein
MNRQITLNQYRAIDLGLMTGLMCISQLVIHLAVTRWNAAETGYIVSPVGAVVALVMMRWGPWAAIPAAVGGLLLTLLNGGTAQQMLIYAGGNLLALGALLYLKLTGKERVRGNAVLALLFAVMVQLLMQLGRAAVAGLFGFSAAECLGFITTDVLSILFTVFIVWTVRRIEGLFEDQKNYLLRIQREQKVERGEQF